MVYASPDGRRIDAAYAWPWPAEEAERLTKLREIVEVLERVLGPWRVYFVEEGTPRSRAHSWPWPEETGLFSVLPGCKAPGWPAWAFDADWAEAEKRDEGDVAVGKEAETTELAAPRRNRFSPGCAEDVLALLEEVGRRMSQTQIVERLSAKGVMWSISVVAHTLAEARRRGVVDNESDEKGSGYGLPRWREERGD